MKNKQRGRRLCDIIRGWVMDVFDFENSTLSRQTPRCTASGRKYTGRFRFTRIGFGREKCLEKYIP